MKIDDIVARQMRIERQAEPHCTLLSVDGNTANVFQLYVHDSLGFSVKRGGFMYGHVGEDGKVEVDFIYEPPQHGTETELQLMRNEGTKEKADPRWH